MASAPIKIMTSLATKDFVAEFVAQYQRTTGQALAYENAGGVDIAKRTRAGEVFDVVMLASTVIEALVTEGKLIAGSKLDVVTSSAAVAVPAGAPRPDISSVDALRRAIMAAKSVSYSTGPSGVYLEKLFAQWGIAEAIKARLVLAPPGVPVGSLLATGKAELGFQQLSELIHLQGISVVGPLPASIQLITTFSAGISPTCQQVDAVRTLLDAMVATDATPAKRKHGLEPA